MADEPGGQPSLNGIGMVVIAVLLAVTATRTFSIKDTRPNQPETFTAAGSQRSVVYAQLSEDPFQAVDRFFQQQPKTDDAVDCASWAGRTPLQPDQQHGGCLSEEVAYLQARLDTVKTVVDELAHSTAGTSSVARPVTIEELQKAFDEMKRRRHDEKVVEKVQPVFWKLKHLHNQRVVLENSMPAFDGSGTTLARQPPSADITEKLRPAMMSLVADFEGYEALAEQADGISDQGALPAIGPAFLSEHNKLAEDVQKIKVILEDTRKVYSSSDVAAANPCGGPGSADYRSLPPTECVRPFDSHDIQNRQNSLKIIAVLVHGGSSKTWSEMRLRQRYSIVDALKMSGYQPEDPDRIHLTDMEVLLCRSDKWQQICARKPPFGCVKEDQRGCVPFERFRLSSYDILRPQGRSNEVLVLWIRDDDVFGKDDDDVSGKDNLDSLNILTTIANSVYPQSSYTKSALAVIGPSISVNLESLFRDVDKAAPTRAPCSWPAATPTACAANAPICPNATATATSAQDLSAGDGVSKIDRPAYSIADVCLMGDPHAGLHIFDAEATKALPFEVQHTRSYNSDPSVGMKFRFQECSPGNQGFCFSRTGAPDSGFAEELARELARRQLLNSSFRTALVVDAGSIYALSLQHRLQERLSVHGRENGFASPDDIVPVVYFFPGVDGHSPGEFTGKMEPDLARPGTRPAEDRSGSVKPDGFDLAPRATGPAQVDYIRRLRTLADPERGGRPIGAIGLITTDIYDTLLIAQALRPSFPKALFFTTFLDAQMEDPNVINSTRGMIVSSNFGLHAVPSLGPNISIPDFRDDFGPANFLTTMYIAQCDVNDVDLLSEASTTALCDKLKEAVDPKAPPRIYQIGYSGIPLQLTNRGDAGLPPLEGRLSLWARVIIGMCFVCAIIGVRFANLLADGESFRKGMHSLVLSAKQRDLGFWLSIAAAAVPVLVLVFWGYVSHLLTESGEGEGLGWTDGLSLWPAVWLQVLALLVAGWFIHLVLCLLNRSTVNLAQKFRLDFRQDVALDFRDDVADALRKHRLRLNADILLREKNAEIIGSRDELRMDVYWRDYYLGRCAILSRCARAAVLSCFILAPVELIDWAFPGDALITRGMWVHHAYVFSSFLCKLSVVFLVSLVFDATLNSRRLVNRVRKASETDWPISTVIKYRSNLGFSGPRLSDWIDLEFTTTRTAVILILVWFPFAVIALMMIAKLLAGRINDAQFIATILVTSLMLISCVVSLRYEAERQRARALKRLRNLASRLPEPAGTITGPTEGDDQVSVPEAGGTVPPEPSQHQVTLLIERIEALREGAFVPTLQQPLIKAVLFPIAAGAWPLIEQYTAR